MPVVVVAMPQQEFDAWLSRQKREATALAATE
jgi:heme/copper-type cytochrome/quinol oxidase subunit 2